MLTERSCVVLDAGGLERLDVPGRHALVVLAHIAATRGARLRLANPSPVAIRELTRAGTARDIALYTDLADALEA